MENSKKRAPHREGRIWPLALVVLVVVLATTGCRGAPREEPGPRPPPANLDELRTEIADILREERIPGAGIALVDGTRVIWVGGVGLADLRTGAVVTGDTQFRVGSITKSFVALGVAKLAEDRKLALDAPLDTIVGKGIASNAWNGTHPLTLAHVLEHTAGFAEEPTLREQGVTESPDAPVLPLSSVLAIDRRSREARWPPGARYDYSDVGPTVAAFAIERVTGLPWEDYLHDEVLVPLHMGTARLRLGNQESARLAQGYVGPDQLPRPFYSYDDRPAGFLMASASEMANLVVMLCGRGTFEGQRFLTEATVERIERGATLAHEIPAQTYGLGNMARHSIGYIARGHGGQMDGFLSEYGYVRELGVGWVTLMNSNHVDATGDAWRAQVRLRRLLFGYLSRDRLAMAPAAALGAIVVGTEPDAIAPQFETRYLRVAPRWPWTLHRDAFLLASAFVLTSLPFGLLHAVRRIRRRGPVGVAGLSLLGGPLYLLLGLALAAMTMQPPALDAPIGARAIAMLVLPIAYALATAISAAATWRTLARREGSKATRAYGAVLLLANSAVVSYLAAMGLLGVRFWS